MAAQANIKAGGQPFSQSHPAFEDVHIRDRATTIARNDVLGATSILTSGVVVYTYFTARKTISGVNRLSTYTSVVTATVTTSKVGVYEENASTGDLTLVGVSANEAGTAWLAADAETASVLTTTFDLKAGRRYAVAVLSVATTPPILLGMPAVGATLDASMGAILGRSPKMAAQNASETDLVASVTNAQAAAFTALPIRVYAELYKV